jgi:hypothetical protein
MPSESIFDEEPEGEEHDWDEGEFTCAECHGTGDCPCGGDDEYCPCDGTGICHSCDGYGGV